MAALAALLLVGCGSGRKDDGDKTTGKSKGPDQAEPAPLPPAEPLPLGKPDLASFAYSRGPGRVPFERALIAEGQGQWQAVEASCRQALEADPGHLEAAWLLAVALARQGAYDRVLEPLSVAVAGDWLRWGERSLQDQALTGFLRSVHGHRYRNLAETYRERFRQALAQGLLVVGRRGEPWYPRRTGEVVVNHRSELYAYDPAGQRYVRMSRTNGSLVGYVRAPVGAAVMYASYRRIVVPAGKTPYFAEVRVGAVDLNQGRMSTREVPFADAEAVHVSYETGPGNVMVAVARVQSSGNGQGGQNGTMRAYALDFETGQARELDTAPGTAPGAAAPAETLVVTPGRVYKLRIPVDGVSADWDDAGAAGAFRLQRTGKTITLEAGESANGHSMIWSPTRARLAFATAAQTPCSGDAAAGRVTLYAADADTGKLRQVATGEATLAAVWLDDTRLAYMDGTGLARAVQIVDVVTGEAVTRIEVAGGVGTDRVDIPPGCPVHAATPETADPAAVPALPGEQGAAGSEPAPVAPGLGPETDSDVTNPGGLGNLGPE